MKLTLKGPNGAVQRELRVDAVSIDGDRLPDVITATAESWAEMLEAVATWLGWPREMRCDQVLETLVRMNELDLIPRYQAVS